MTPDNEMEELLDLLAWAFGEAESWLWDARGNEYHALDHGDKEAERIREILRAHGKYKGLFEK